MIVDTLQDATMSEDEFKALLYLDRRLFEETARDRFSLLDTNLEPSHPDSYLRLEANAHFRDAVHFYVEQNRGYLEQQDAINIIEVGASLGAISSLYILDALFRLGLIDKVQLTLLDICRMPLERTKEIDFDLESFCKKADFKIPTKILRRILQKARIIQRNALETQVPDDAYTISLAAFIHHHLNIYDKEIACRELERITKKDGGIIVGDLTFLYDEFVKWLEKHKTECNSRRERIPYAVESFVSLERHHDFFKQSSLAFKQQYQHHYVFLMKKGAKNV